MRKQNLKSLALRLRFAEKLSELMKLRGISIHKLADGVHVTRVTIRSWMYAYIYPSDEHYLALCDYFGVSDDFFTRKDIDTEAAQPQQLEIDAQPVQSVPMKEPVPVKFAGDDSSLNDVIAAAVKYGGTVELDTGAMKVFATFFGQQNRKEKA